MNNSSLIHLFGFTLDRDLILNNLIPLIIYSFLGWIFIHILQATKSLFSKITFIASQRLPQFLSVLFQKTNSLIVFMGSPKAKAIYTLLIAFSLLFVLNPPYSYLEFIALFAVGISQYRELLRKGSSSSPILFETFDNLHRWSTKSGNPMIDKNWGNPQPSLFLPIANGQNSLVELKKINFTNGAIELDVYLEPNSLCNVIFRANLPKNQYYMARFDSRLGNHDCFLRNDGNGWFPIASTNNTSTSNQWHKMKIVVSGNTFQLYNENGLLLSITDTTYSSGSIGIFNEVSNARVDNLMITN